MQLNSLLFPQAMIVVVDSTDRERLSLIKEELYKMLAHEVSGAVLLFQQFYCIRSHLLHFFFFFKKKDLRKAHVLVFANKQDVKGAMTAAEISTKLNLSSLKDHSWHIQACCALTGEGLYNGMEWVTTQVNKT